MHPCYIYNLGYYSSDFNLHLELGLQTGIRKILHTMRLVQKEINQRRAIKANLSYFNSGAGRIRVPPCIPTSKQR